MQLRDLAGVVGDQTVAELLVPHLGRPHLGRGDRRRPLGLAFEVVELLQTASEHCDRRRHGPLPVAGQQPLADGECHAEHPLLQPRPRAGSVDRQDLAPQPGTP